MNEITLLIADDHPLFRQGVVDTLSLEEDFRIVGQASNGTEAIERIRALKPRVAVLDVNMPGLNGQQVTHQVTSEHLPTRVVLLTGYDDIEQAIHAVLAGAYGYCAKDIQPEVLARTVRAVADGRKPVPGIFSPVASSITGLTSKWTVHAALIASLALPFILSPIAKWKSSPALCAG